MIANAAAARPRPSRERPPGCWPNPICWTTPSRSPCGWSPARRSSTATPPATPSSPGVRIRAGDLVTVSLAGANRDPAVFTDPDRFDLHRPNARLQLAFAHGPHYCVGAHLARLEARTALRACFERLPGLSLDDRRPSAPRGLVFRKPPTLAVRWRH